MVKLSKRLATIASFITPDSYLADVGSDHGYLPIYLLQNGLVRGAMAIENKEGPFASLLNNVKEEAVEDRLICSYSSGLDELTPLADSLSICGIGGILTLEILNKGKEKLANIKEIILDPHRDLPKLREGMVELGYCLRKEKMVYEDGLYYTIMKWGRGSLESPYSEKELLLGPFLLKEKEPIFLAYLKERQSILESLLKKNLPEQQRQEYSHQLAMVMEELKN